MQILEGFQTLSCHAESRPNAEFLLWSGLSQVVKWFANESHNDVDEILNTSLVFDFAKVTTTGFSQLDQHIDFHFEQLDGFRDAFHFERIDACLVGDFVDGA